MNKQILIIATSHSRLGTTDKITGLWAEELAEPYYALADAGLDITIASPRGGKVTIDPASIKPVGENPAAVERFLKDDKLRKTLDNSVGVDALRDISFDAVFFPGGHGTMWDLPDNATVARIVKHNYARGGIIAAVCHGPAGLVNVVGDNGRPIVEGKRVNAFTNDEEEMVGLTQTVPFLLETRLRESGAKFENGPSFEPFAIRDGNLITGQNPMSSTLVARHVLEALGVSARQATPAQAEAAIR